MKLYVYASVFLTFVEAKWAFAEFASGGILLGTLLLLGVVNLNQSVEIALGSRSANALTAENNILLQQISLIAPRENKLEVQAGQLRDRANKLHELLERRRPVRNSVVSFMNAAEGSKLQPSMAAVRIPRP